MFDSIWSRSPLETTFFFLGGLVLWTLFWRRASIRLGSDAPLRKPATFGALAGAAFGVVLAVYCVVVSLGGVLTGIEGSALTAAAKLATAAYPATRVLPSTAPGLLAAALVVQEAIFGAIVAGLANRFGRARRADVDAPETPTSRR